MVHKSLHAFLPRAGRFGAAARRKFRGGLGLLRGRRRQLSLCFPVRARQQREDHDVHAGATDLAHGGRTPLAALQRHRLQPDYAVALDVSFAVAPDVSPNNCGKLGGGPMLVHGGRNVAEENYWKEIFDCGGLQGLARHPRTAIGATEDGKLVIVVCDGRNKRGSAGMTLPELADKMISLGCVEAINLDGGGSSTFVGREGRVLNMPSDTPGTTAQDVALRERSVPTAVIIAEQ